MNGRTPLRRLSAAALMLAGAAACTPITPLLGAMGATTVGAAEERSAKAQFSDAETEATVNARLLNFSPEMFRRVGVDVVEGRVLLSGAVSTQDQRLKAEQLAWEAPGAREVLNELTLNGDPALSTYSQDVWITTQLRSRMIADARIMSVNYNIETHRGVVHLLGLARSDAELARVAEIAARVPGVTQVVSHVLAVDDPRRKGV